MIKISINEAISHYWGICEKDISDQLKAATPGEEIEISINSPGGEVYEGIAIFNLIREYAKSHNIIVKINGLAASIASYIAIAARTVRKDSKIIVLENSIFLIHNPWIVTWGDYRDLFKIKTVITNKGWNLEFTIPLSFLRQFFPALELRPGLCIKGNFYKCGDKTAKPHYGCWSPIDLPQPDFHCPYFFGDLVLE